MKRLKLKSNVKKYGIISITVIAVIIFISIGIYSYINIKKQKELEKTPEYKLSEIGYSEDDIKILTKFYKDKELNYFLENKKNDDYIGIISEKHFIKDYFNDYLEYLKEARDTNYALAVEKVNTKTNKEYYTDPEVTDTSKNELMLVNKYYYLPEDYEPNNLENIDGIFTEEGENWSQEDYIEQFKALPNESILPYIISDITYNDNPDLVYDSENEVYKFEIVLSGHNVLSDATLSYSREISYTCGYKNAHLTWKNSIINVAIDNNFNFKSIDYNEFYTLFAEDLPMRVKNADVNDKFFSVFTYGDEVTL